MENEVFKAVQTAENKADQLIQEAQKNAREQLKAVEAELTANERKAALEHRALYQRAMDERRDAVNRRIEAAAPDNRARREQSLAQARQRLDGAAELILERVWNDGNR